MATNQTEEIIEKRDTSPLATSCLALAVLAILGAIALQVAELSELRKTWSPREKEKGQIAFIKAETETFIDKYDEVLKLNSLVESERDEAKAIVEGRDGAPGTLHKSTGDSDGGGGADDDDDDDTDLDDDDDDDDLDLDDDDDLDLDDDDDDDLDLDDDDDDV